VARADGGPLSFARLLTPPKTFTAQYSCDLSAYQGGIPPVSLNATATFPGAAQTLVPAPISLKTTSVSLPASVLSQLSGVTSVDLTATATALQQNVPVPVTLSGKNPVSGTLTGLPSATAQTSDSQPFAFTLPGTGQFEVPLPTLTFTPRTNAAVLPAINCTTTAPARDIPVTVKLGVLGTKGPLYLCDLSALHVDVEEFEAHIPMMVTESGPQTTGKTVTVRLVAGIGGVYPPGTSAVRLSADLPVAGAQPGNVALSERITDLTSSVTRASGALRLTKTGTDRILVPEKFKFTFTAPVQGTQIQFAFTFTIKTQPAPVGVTLKIAKGHSHPQPSGSPTPSAGQPEGSGTPSGAPATGGGTRPGSDTAAVTGGLAIMMCGGGFVLMALRRRRRQRPS
jgi:hypothetical protein